MHAEMGIVCFGAESTEFIIKFGNMLYAENNLTIY